jgi:hypothetical protein
MVKKAVGADLSNLRDQPLLSDHHSDIYRDEIYRLIAWFLFSGRP